jgi:DNA polymerase-1
MMTERVCLIDGSGYIFRAFFATPRMTNPEGTPVNAVYGFINMFLSLTANIKCDYCLVLFDAKRQNFRNEFFKDYKATRPELPEDLKPQFDLIHQAVVALNLNWLQMEGYEADDLIATYTAQALKEGKEVTIVSADKDLMQLIREGVSFYDGMKNKYFTPEDVKEKFGVYPDKVTDVQALAGDSTDNVPGVAGIGLKTAAELVNQFGSLEGVLAHAEEIKQNKRRETILAHKEEALISQKLVTLKPDVPVETSIADFRCTCPDTDTLLTFLERHAFKSLKTKAVHWLENRSATLPKKETEPQTAYTPVTTAKELHALSQKIKEITKFAFLPYADEERLLGIAVAVIPGVAYYLPLAHETPAVDLFSAPSCSEGLTKAELLQFLTPLFTDNAILKISLNLKTSVHTLTRFLGEINFPSPYDDVAVISYDLWSAAETHTLEALSQNYLHRSLKSTAPEYKKLNFATLPLAEAVTFFAEEADFTLRLHELFRPQLREKQALYIYDAIDRPLIKTLYDMEHAGVKIDTAKLKEMDSRFEAELSTISEQIFALAGESFNLSSPKQIGDILFNKLGLKGKKHASGTLNTSADALEQLAEENEIVQKILEWRQYQKLKSTYTTALLALMDKAHRVHTTYSQISVNTGRLSSLTPNLQNIPIRTPLGREIRSSFIAKEGCKLIAADYSQVELRLLATIADVKFLQEAFKEGVDIHRKTASQVFNIPYDAVDSEHRRRAKAINFGIVYGMSAYGLSKEIDTTPAEAQTYIDAYFANMPEVKTYMEQTINFARQNGYVLTPYGRKMTIFGIAENNKRLAAFAERAAINAPIQGGAADIIKLAMTRIANRLAQEGFKTKMLLQVHDELVFEAPLEEAESVSTLIKAEMENIIGMTLKVPLIAEVGIGDNWGEAH